MGLIKEIMVLGATDMPEADVGETTGRMRRRIVDPWGINSLRMQRLSLMLFSEGTNTTRRKKGCQAN